MPIATSSSTDILTSFFFMESGEKLGGHQILRLCLVLRSMSGLPLRFSASFVCVLKIQENRMREYPVSRLLKSSVSNGGYRSMGRGIIAVGQAIC